MSEDLRNDYKTPWGMPPEVFWEYSDEDAELHRLEWMLQNRPELTLDEIQFTMPFTNRTLAKAGLAKAARDTGPEANFLG